MVVKVRRLTFEYVRVLSSDLDTPVRKKYEKLVNLIAEYGGRVHGSQHSINSKYDVNYDVIAVYFQIPLDAKEEFEKEYGQ